MSNRPLTRLVAGVAAAGLLLLGLPATLTTANAQTTPCALGATCEGNLAGTLGTSPYTIKMPSKFNGTVLVYSHGYRFATPIPERFAGALGLVGNPSYDRVTLTGTDGATFTAAFGSATAYIGNNRAEIVPAPAATLGLTAAAASAADLEASLLAKGYALAGVGYARQGWATAEGVEANTNLITLINSGGVSGVKKIAVWGSSLGSSVALATAQANPRTVSGVMPLCGVEAGPVQAFDTAMTVLFTWKTLVAPTLRVANYQSYAQALTDLATVLTTLSTSTSATVSQVGYPVYQANFLAGLLGGLPTKSGTFDGLTINPLFLPTLASGNTALAVTYSPTSSGSSSLAAMLQNVGAAAALGILGRYELEQRARAAGNLPAGSNLSFNGNLTVDYSKLLSTEQRAQFADALNANAAGQEDLLDRMFAQLNLSKGNTTLRYQSNPQVVGIVNALPGVTGRNPQPTVAISDLYDPITPAGNLLYFTGTLAPKKSNLVAYYTVPPATGYTQFTPAGAVAPTTAVYSGVGHCNFADNNGGQLKAVVDVLATYMTSGNVAGAAKANSVRRRTNGIESDREFLPPPLKDTAAASQ